MFPIDIAKAYAKKFGKGKEEVKQMGSWMNLALA
jgi:hypothetical protein